MTTSRLARSHLRGVAALAAIGALAVLAAAVPAGAAAGDVTTIAGNGAGAFAGDGGPALAASFSYPRGLAVAPDGTIYVDDAGNFRIREISPAGIVTTLAGDGNQGDSGDAGPATAAEFTQPDSIALDSAHHFLYLADFANNRVRRIDLNAGTIDGYAGCGFGCFGYSGDGGPAATASFEFPEGVAVGPGGDVYIADTFNCVVRKVDFATQVVSTVAGADASCVNGGDGDGGPATQAHFDSGLYRVDVDAAGDLFVLDNGVNGSPAVVREVDAATGIIHTVAGGGATTPGSGPAISMNIGLPLTITHDDGGNLYIGNSTQVYKVALASDQLSVLAGSGVQGYSGDGGPATAAAFDTIWGMALDPSGDLLLSDSNNARIRSIESIVSADVVVTDCSDPSLAGLTSIPGNLVVDNVPGCTSLSLPNLQHVGGNVEITGDSSVTTVDLGSLSSVGGNFDVTGDSSVTSVSLGSLSSAGGTVDVSGDSSVTSVSLGSLSSAGGLDVENDPNTTSVQAPTLDSLTGSLDISNDGALTAVDTGAVTTAGDVTISNDPNMGTLDVGALTTAGDVTMTNDGTGNIDVGMLTTAGDVTITDNTSATNVDVHSLATVGGDVTITGNTSSTDVQVAPNASVSGNLTLATTGPVTTQTAGGKTDITVLGGTAAMHVVVPKGAFDQAVAFTITGTGDTPPEQGTGADGAPALIDPVVGDLFTFAVPTLNQNANLTFTVDLSKLDSATRTALVMGVQSGSATIAVKGDAQGSTYQAFARCAPGQTPQANSCVDAVLLDANGQPTQLASAAAYARFDGIAGHFSTYAVSLVTPEADTAPPAVTIKLTAPNNGVPDGQNGWFVTGPVKGAVTADDSKSGGSNIASLDCGSLTLTTTGIGTPSASGTFSISAEGITHISCTAKDSAGNTSSPVAKDVQLDTHAPTLAPTVGPTPILLHGNAAATPNASDSVSGVASQSCAAVDTSAAGLHSVTCTATDKAGNTATQSVSYLVQYKILGFFSPAPNSKWKAGQTVPIKFALADANGTRIPDSEAQALLASPCRVMFSATGAQKVANTCVKYDTTNHQYVYNWNLAKQTGNETITVTVSYPGTTGTTTLSEPIVITP